MPNSNRSLHRPLRLWRLLGAVLAAMSLSADAAEQAAVQIRLFSSVTPGLEERHAISFTKPMIDLLSRQLAQPMEVGIENGKDLMAFGKDLDEGKTHIGVVWGLEYGWLRQRYPRLEIMAVTTQGGQVQIPAQLLVRKDFPGKTIADLKGKKLATYERAPMMILRFRNKVLKDKGFDPKTFFKEITTFETPKGAIGALKSGNVHVVEIDGMTWSRYGVTQSLGKNSEIKTFVNPQSFPEAVIVGRPDKVECISPPPLGQPATKALVDP